MSEEHNGIEIFDIVEKWLDNAGMLIGRNQDANAVRYSDIKVGDTMVGSIVLEKEDSYELIIALVAPIPDNIREILNNLPNEKFEKFWYELYTELIKFGVDFQALKSKKDVVAVVINYRFVFEEIFLADAAVPKHLFFEKLATVRKAALFVLHCSVYHSGKYSEFLGLRE